MFIVLRIVSLVLVVLALMLLGADAVSSLESNGDIKVRALEEVWAMASPSGAAWFKAFVFNNLPGMVSGWIFAALGAPGWAVTGVIGVVLAFLFGRRAGGPE